MSGLFGSIFGARRVSDAAARFQQSQMDAIAYHNQINAMRAYPRGFHFLAGLSPGSMPEKVEPEPTGMDAVQSLAYDPERYPHCIEIDARQ